MSKPKKKEIKSNIVSRNKKASHDYTILDKLETGIVLIGCEVKSLRQNTVSLKDSYARVIHDELWLIGCHIPPYTQGNSQNTEPTRDRKLLVHKKELHRLIGKVQKQGLTLVPTKLYFKRNIAKLEIGLAKSKKLFDKRHALKEKQQKREMLRATKVSL